MIIGIISDVHDNARTLLKVIKIFNLKGVSLVINCGDFATPSTLLTLKNLKCPVISITGNEDSDIRKYELNLLTDLNFKDLNIDIKPVFQEVKVDNKRIAVVHGDNLMLIDVLNESQLFDLICFGHSHKPVIQRDNKTLLINPGTLKGVYTGEFDEDYPPTCALFDTLTNEADIIKVEDVKV